MTEAAGLLGQPRSAPSRDLMEFRDLRKLRDGGRFVVEGAPRVALVHYGFRNTSPHQAQKRRARFASRYPSLGLLNLARSLEVDAEAGAIPCRPEIRYFDEDCFHDDEDLKGAILLWAREARWRFLLVGVYTAAAERTSAWLSTFDPADICIVVGGPHVTVAPSLDYAHFVVRGEGGGALRYIINALVTGSFDDGPDSRGVCFVHDGHPRTSPTRFDNSLATLPAPAYDYSLSESRTDQDQRPRGVWWKTAGRSPQIYVCTQSCRARCTFCSTYLIHGNLVSRPLELIRKDLEHIVGVMGHDSIEFHDDDILQHEDFDGLLALLADAGVTWTCNARTELIDADLAKRMYRGGCRKVFLGIESLDQRTLDYLRKGTTVEANEQATRVLDAAGIGVAAGLIIGAPHDTVDSILDDIDRFLALPIFYLSPAILTPDIGTVEFVRARKRIPALRLLGDDGTSLNMKPRPDLFGRAEPYGLPTVCDAVSKEDLNELYELAVCSFFLRESALERVRRYTRPEREIDLNAWLQWMWDRAASLSRKARLDRVRDRVGGLLPASARG